MADGETTISPCDTRGCFFDGSGRSASTPNALRGIDHEIDERAVFSVLQFGAIVPPLSPWHGVQRLASGYRYEMNRRMGPVDCRLRRDISGFDQDQQADEVECNLDRILTKYVGNNDNPVLLFSGGVDSGLIASRLAALGYRDCLLINYSFGDEDPESLHAEAMASHLRLPFQRVLASRDIGGCLSKPGKVWSQPFADQSTVPTSDLANAVVRQLKNGDGRLILDGIGADGAFGMSAKIGLWARMNRLPKSLRRAASLAYCQRLWQRSGRLEYAARIMRRSVEMPMLSAVIAQNPLAGILYSEAHRAVVDESLATWVTGWAGTPLARCIIGADLALTCANVFAQKAKPILEQAGHRVEFPFLDSEMVSLALSAADEWGINEPKAPLKRSLARCVPRELVFRPKSGFVGPGSNIFHEALFIEHLRSAADPTGPISHLLHTKPLLKSTDLLNRKKTLPAQTLNCLWAIVFTDRWYRTALDGPAQLHQSRGRVILDQADVTDQQYRKNGSLRRA